MDRLLLERHLAMAERHIAFGERIASKQRELIGELEHNGQNSFQAKALLAAFEELQFLLVADRDQLKKEIEEIIDVPGKD